jgi:hypothetical protein
MKQGSAKDMLARRVVPSAVIALSQISWPSRLGAASRRALGRRGRLELFFAFDDPCSAIAVIDLAERVSGRDVLLVLKPVVERGISDDPAAELKRHYAIADAQRLGRRRGLMLTPHGAPDRRGHTLPRRVGSVGAARSLASAILRERPQAAVVRG